MPYSLELDPKKKGYAWVITEATRVRHSKKSLPLERAKSQLKLLYYVQSRTEPKKKKLVKG